MITMKFLDLFDPIRKGNFGLTDFAIYQSTKYGKECRIPVYGAYREHFNANRFVPTNARTKYNKPITVFTGRGIIINFDGVSAGCMTYKEDEKFALNHHAGFFRVKKGAERLILPKYFALFHQQQLQNAAVSSDQKTLTIDLIYSMDFNIPSYEIQKQIMSEIKKILTKKTKLYSILTKIQSLKNRFLDYKYSTYQARGVPIKILLNCLSGNSGLIEELIYEKSQLEGLRYTVLSSSTTEKTRLGQIPMCYINDKPLKVFEDKKGILVIRNGKAGTTFFLEKGKYTINDHAYILSLKKNLKYEVMLKWLMVQYRKDFFEYSSSSDNGTWNKTGFFKNMKVDLPSIDEQKKVLKVYEKLEQLEKKLGNIKNRIESLFTKQILVV